MCFLVPIFALIPDVTIQLIQRIFYMSPADQEMRLMKDP